MGSGMAMAQTECNETEQACMLSAIWGAALSLPEDKRTRVKPAMMEAAARSGDEALIAVWSQRLEAVIEPPSDEDAADFGWRQARDLLEAGGIKELISTARARRAPLAYGRADALLAAGKRFTDTAPDKAKRLNDELMSLARTASDFEKNTLAHAAAELAMYRCDRQTLMTAKAMTQTPDNLRYKLWLARLDGDALALRRAITDDADTEDTRHVRQALDGYRPIQERGYCRQP